MTNITKSMLDAALKEVQTEWKKKIEEVLGRIKSLEDESTKMKEEVKSLKEENKDLKTRVEAKESMSAEEVDTAGLWAKMVKLPEVKNGISSIVAVEADHSNRGRIIW